jgi:phosphatidylserine/phosphatidylglycerophosphate/cardiolipin synthase-like enzyme
LKVQLQQNQGTFLRTEEHRAVLERALKEAREEVIIISPWLNRRTCDDALCDLFAAAIKRNVRVRIGYGITERAGDADDGRNRANAQKVNRALRAAVAREASPEQAALLDIQRTSDTHQKILVCDRAFAALGSFNWLSYRGDLDSGYRNETSIVLHEPASVEELARISLKGWPQQKG